MDLSLELTKRLDQLAAQQPLPQDSHVQLQDAGRQLDCVIVAAEQLACSLREVTVEEYIAPTSGVAGPSASGAAGASASAAQRLRQVCDDLARRLCYLNEPISVIEIDKVGGVGQLRSVAPSPAASGVPAATAPSSTGPPGNRYFEVVVNQAGSINVRRYEKQPGLPRQLIPATLTREIFLQLATDLWNTRLV